MKKSDKILSALISTAMTLVFVSAAAFFALHYNSWFTQETSARSAVSFSDTSGNTVTLHMESTGVSEGISDETLYEMNTYGFPTGDSPYFIYVEKGAHTLSVFEKDAYGLYTKRVYTWSTATGKTNLLTPVGTFAVGEKEEWHTWPAKTVSLYATKYYSSDNHYGGLFIHGPIYGYKAFYSLFENSARKIGTNCSSGCLRTETEAAYFVYEMCPEGTMVRIVEGSPLGFTPDRIVYPYNQSHAPSLERFVHPSKELSGIRFAEESHTMYLGEQYNPELIFSPDDAGYFDLNWTTNNPSIIKLSGESIWAVGNRYYQRQPSQSCAYDGLDRFFTYSSDNGGYCSISTVPMLSDGSDAICEIEFNEYTRADYQSSMGIRLGDSLYDIKRAYGPFYTEISMNDEKHPEKSYIRITYWAGKANDPGVPSLYFTLDPVTKKVKGMGIYSSKNMG